MITGEIESQIERDLEDDGYDAFVFRRGRRFSTNRNLSKRRRLTTRNKRRQARKLRRNSRVSSRINRRIIRRSAPKRINRRIRNRRIISRVKKVAPKILPLAKPITSSNQFTTPTFSNTLSRRSLTSREKPNKVLLKSDQKSTSKVEKKTPIGYYIIGGIAILGTLGAIAAIVKSGRPRH